MLRSLLRFPSVYSCFSYVVGGNSRERYTREYLQPKAGQRVLDLGCGPGDILDHMPNVDYLGIDVSPQYVQRCRERFGSRGRFRCEDIFTTRIEAANTYDLVAATGVLHHLCDAKADRLLAVAANAVTANGTVVTLDGCWLKEQSLGARLFLALDRGEHIRTPEAYRSLASRHFARVDTRIVRDLLRIPYTHFIMTCSQPIRN